MINFTKPQQNNRRFIQQVQRWVEDALPEDMEDVMVMVTEMQCFEPVSATPPAACARAHARS